jgi:hypothetical protein
MIINKNKLTLQINIVDNWERAWIEVIRNNMDTIYTHDITSFYDIAQTICFFTQLYQPDKVTVKCFL